MASKDRQPMEMGLNRTAPSLESLQPTERPRSGPRHCAPTAVEPSIAQTIGSVILALLSCDLPGIA